MFDRVLHLVAAVVRAIVAPIVFVLSPKHACEPHADAPDATWFPYYMRNKQGLWLKWTVWRPATKVGAVAQPPRGVVFLVGGLAEHNARYDCVALRLNEEGYVCFSMDHQGQGLSEGTRKHVERFDDYVDDYVQFVRSRMEAEPDLAAMPRFLLGHSMGGLIATRLAMRHPRAFHGVVLSAPALMPDPLTAPPTLRKIARLLASVLPKLGIDRLNPKFVSRNPAIVEQYISDPTIDKGKLRALWASQMLDTMETVFADAPRLATFPFLLIHGSLDHIVPITGSEKFMAAAASKDKTLRRFDDYFHELFTDAKGGEQVFRAVLPWLRDHIDGASSPALSW